jgi:tRNA (mo5U34)-methyltransferase
VWAQGLQAQLDSKMEKGHGDLERWQSALDALPKIQPSEVDLLNGLTLDTDCDDATRAQMHTALMGLSPWRKGPFICSACTSTPNGARTGSGRGSHRTWT